MTDATGLAEAMLGLPGFRVTEVQQSEAEVTIRIETEAVLEPCLGCGVVATAHDRMPVEHRDLAIFGRALRAWCGASGAGAARSLSARCAPGQRPRRPSRPGAF